MAYDKIELPTEIDLSTVTDVTDFTKIPLNYRNQDFYQHSTNGNYKKLTWVDNNEPTITANRLQLFEDVAMMFTNISELNDAAGISSIIDKINRAFKQRVKDIKLVLGELNTVISIYNDVIENLNTLISNHAVNEDNPHKVTSEQVGLGNVDNKSTDTIKSEFTGAVAPGNEGFVTGDAVAQSITNLSEGQVKTNKEAIEVVREQLDNKFESFDILVCERF